MMTAVSAGYIVSKKYRQLDIQKHQQVSSLYLVLQPNKPYVLQHDVWMPQR
jgi:hypothetical protein